MRIQTIGFRVGVAVLALGAFAPVSSAAQAETYLLEDLGTLGGLTSQSRSINNFGLVAGWANNSTQQVRAVVLATNLLTDLGTLGGPNSAAMDINGLGQAAGWANPAGSAAQKAFLYSAGSMMDLGALLPGSTNSVGFGINDLGTVVGGFRTSTGRERPFIYANGMIPLEFEGAATCINTSGEIGGYEVKGAEKLGFIISGVDRRYVGTLGGTETEVARISSNSVAVGRSKIANGPLHAFAHQEGEIHDLGTLGGLTSEAYGINSLGHIVGRAADKTQATRAFVYRRGMMFDLNSFLPPDSGWVLEVAYAINDSGQIVGAGRIKGQRHGYILTPNFLEMALYPGLTITGKAGRRYRIDYLDALNPTNSWQVLTNLVLPSSPHFFLDPRPVLFANRLYRSVLLPETAP